MKSPKDNNKSGLWLFLVLIAAALPYIQSLNGGFLLDDNNLILQNHYAHSLANAGHAFCFEFFRGNTDATPYYRPLVNISYQLNYSLSGPSPFAFRLTNLILYLITTALVFITIKKLANSTFIAGVAGLIFAVLPSHVENVGWASGRTDVMATLFLLAGFLMFLKGYRESKFTWLNAVVCSIFFLCAMFSKETGIILPVFIALYIWIFGDSTHKKGLWKLALALAFSISIYAILHTLALNNSASHMDNYFLVRRLQRIGSVYGLYLRLLFIPCEYQVDFSTPSLNMDYLSPLMLGAWLFPVGLLILSVYLRKRQPVLAFGTAWIFIALLPVSNIVHIHGRVPTERFIFTASIGSALIIGWLIRRMLQIHPRSMRTWPIMVYILVGAYILHRMLLAFQAAQVYRSELSWSRYVAATKPQWWAFRSAAGKCLLDAGDFKTAAVEFEAANRMNYVPPTDKANAIFSAGLAYVCMGDMDKAADAFRQTITIKPSFFTAWRNLGRAEFSLENYPEAVNAYKQAASLKKLSAKDSFDLGMAYKLTGQTGKAVHELKNVISLSPRGNFAEKAKAELASLIK